MSPALRIALGELRSLFYSPIAWLLLIVMIVQTSMSFIQRLEALARYLGDASYTVIMFAQFFGVTNTLQNNLFLYVPLLTMGLIAREVHSGSIKLLLSSPVDLGQIVFGKYLAVMAYFLLMMVFMLGLVIASGVFIDHLDYGLALAGVLGVYLLACAYAAVGLLMSSLTSHQIVAALGTLAVLTVFSFIGSWGQRVPVLDDITYWLSVAGRADMFRQGLISSKDVFYFVAIAALFLALTYLKLSARRSFESRTVRAAKTAGAIGAVVAFGAVTSLPALTFYKDATRDKRMTLSKGSQAVMAEVQGPWRVTAYANVLDNNSWSFLPGFEKRMSRSLFDQYLRVNPDMTIDSVHYYALSANSRLYDRNPGKSNAELAYLYAYQNRMDFDAFVSPEEAAAAFDLDAEESRSLYVLSHDGNTALVRTFADGIYQPQELTFSTGLKRLTQGPQTVAYVTGQGERRARMRGGANHFRNMGQVSRRFALVNLGFDIEELALDRPVPEHVDILVLAAPLASYSDAALGHLRDYVAGGGGLLVYTEPASYEALAPVLSDLGLAQLAGQLVQSNDDFPEDLVFARFTAEGAALGFAPLAGAEGDTVALPGAAALQQTGQGPFTATSVLAIDRAALGFALERDVGGRNQRVAVLGDADFLSSAVEDSQDLQGLSAIKGSLLFATFRWLSHGAYPIDTSRPVPIDRTMHLELRQVDYVKIVLYGVIPGALFLSGAGLIASRRRH